MQEVTKIKINKEYRSIFIKGLEWNLRIKRVTITKGNNAGKDMLLIVPVKCTYDGEKKDFRYDDMQKPIWLELHEKDTLGQAIVEL